MRFALTDTAESVPVVFAGILPDLFREGQGVVAMGRLDESGTFVADEVLAKHDENYMPPEVAEALEKAGRMPGTAAELRHRDGGRSLIHRPDPPPDPDSPRDATMIPELGHFSLILALCTAIVLATFAARRAASAGTAAGWRSPSPPPARSCSSSRSPTPA